jgi:hypothetical protein
MDFADGMELIKQAIKSDVEDKLWQQYLFEHIFMDESNFMSFEDYKNQAIDTPTTTVKLSAKDIIKNAEKIKNIDQARKEVTDGRRNRAI